MNAADRESLETRVLVLAPTVKDAELTRAILARAGITCVGCPDQVQVCEQLTAGAGAVLIAEEAVHGGDGCLAEWLGRQPPWSDLPVLVLARTGADSVAVARAMEELGNVTVLERPARVAALVSVVRTALRARQRQYQLRDHLVQRERLADERNRATATVVTTLESITDGFTRFDRDWRVVYVNDEAERMNQRPRAETLGKTIWELFPALVGTKLEAEYRRCVAEQVTIDFDYHYPPWDRWFTLKCYPTPEGGLVAFLRDITEPKKAEERLQTSEARLRVAIEVAGLGVLSIDYNADTSTPDATAAALFGLESGVAVPRSHVHARFHPDDGAEIMRRMRQCLDPTGDGCFAMEHRVVHPDGTTKWLSVQKQIVFGEAGGVRRPVSGVLSAVDISARREAEEELRQLAAALSEADRRKDVFLATLAHELRNPLAPIRTGLEVMRLAGSDGKVEQARLMMVRQVSQLVRLVDDLLDVSRLTQGKVELRKKRVELRAVIDAAVETSRPAIEQAGHELAVVVPDEPIFVDGDAIRLSQVVSNLLNNSAKYTHRGGHIRLTARREGGTVVVSVKDDGIGIPPAMMDKVFVMFTQVNRELEKTTGGLGIGLSLVKGLVEMHGGTIVASSDGEGMGSEFVVRLPVVTPVIARPDRSNGQTSDVVPPALRRILVVDDNEDAADLLSQMLEMLGNEVRTANDGEAGVEVAAQFRPDVVLMDIGMPVLNGHEAARRIRQYPWGRGMVLVALTGWGQKDDRKKSSDAGFDHHLVKPVEMDVLRKLLAGLQKATAERGQEEGNLAPSPTAHSPHNGSSLETSTQKAFQRLDPSAALQNHGAPRESSRPSAADSGTGALA